MTLRDINIGQEFRFINYGNLVWIKRTAQGMHNNYAYCETTTKQKRRNKNKTTTQKLFNQEQEVILLPKIVREV
jgi:hypothetical protein